MKSMLKHVAMLSGSVVAAGCAIPTNPPQAQVVPYQAVRHSAAGAEGYYALGKYYIGQQRPADALIEFTKAVNANPNHIEARNGRATALAQLGEFRSAAGELKTALERAPEAVHLLNNLGYVQTLGGQFDEAAETLRKAFALDPKNERVRANWAALAHRLPSGASLARALDAEGMDVPSRTAKASIEVKDRLNSRPNAAVVAPQLAVIASPVLNITYGATATSALRVERMGSTPLQSAGPTPSISPSIRAASVSVTAGQVVTISPPLPSNPTPAFESREARPATIAPTPTPSPTVARYGDVRVHMVVIEQPNSRSSRLAVPPVGGTAAISPGFRVEVANGNGRHGAARIFGESLRAGGMKVSRVSNAPSFAHPRSIVYFRDGYMNEALSLSRRLSNRPAVMLSTSLAASTDVMVLLGRDTANKMAVLEHRPTGVAKAPAALKLASKD